MSWDARVVAAARDWIGTPYRHQASLRGVGCDCLGLVRGVWRDLYGAEAETPPPYEAGWAMPSHEAEPLLAAAGRHLAPWSGEGPPHETLPPGAVVSFRWRAHCAARHLAIVSAGARMIHAQDGAGVAEVPLSPWWLRRIASIHLFPEPT